MTLELLCYVAFVLGQLLFVLKRAGSAIRSKTNPIKSRREYIYSNWDVLLIRLMLEGVVFIACWHIGFTKILSMFTTWQSPISFPPLPPFYLFFGFFIDSGLDWYGQSNIGPAFLRQFIKENVPDVQVYASKTTETGMDSTGAPVTIEKTVTVEKAPPAKNE
jgi:hypothetical protein